MDETFLCSFQTLGCNFSTSNQAKKAIIQVYIAYSEILMCLFCIKINPKINEIKGKISKTPLEILAIHISVHFINIYGDLKITSNLHLI